MNETPRLLEDVIEELKLLRAEVIDVRAELAAARYANPEAIKTYSAAEWASHRDKEFDINSRPHLNDKQFEVFSLLRKSENVRNER